MKTATKPIILPLNFVLYSILFIILGTILFIILGIILFLLYVDFFVNPEPTYDFQRKLFRRYMFLSRAHWEVILYSIVCHFYIFLMLVESYIIILLFLTLGFLSFNLDSGYYSMAIFRRRLNVILILGIVFSFILPEK